MYRNPTFRDDDLGAILDLINNVKLGTLVSDSNGLTATHFPFVLHRNRGAKGTLVAHVPRADPVWQGFDRNDDMLAIFEGPQAYISPSWYMSKENFPTYHFCAVHVYGRPVPMTSREEVVQHLSELIEIHECGSSNPWTGYKSLGNLMDKLLPGIVGFTMEIERIQGKSRLGQNKSAADREAVRCGLRERGTDADIEIAQMMESFIYASDEASSLLSPVTTEEGAIEMQDVLDSDA